MAPQAAIGVVGNPSLCPAFRVRRGSGRENGFAASRARRATRPTPERISVPCGHGADISSRRVCWGITRRPLRPALSRLAVAQRGRAWEPARESGGDADRIDRHGGRARGATESSADAREGSPRRRSLHWPSSGWRFIRSSTEGVRRGAVTGRSARRRRPTRASHRGQSISIDSNAGCYPSTDLRGGPRGRPSSVVSGPSRFARL